MMEIKYVCSLGSLCHSSQILKNNGLKICSYPFDWIFSSCDTILHCIEDNFKIFLNKSYYVRLSKKHCGHSYYNKQMFYHHNPLDNKNDYNYYVRCVDRFKQLVQYEEHKLFIMIFVNLDNIEENHKNDIINFNNKFSKYTKNYTLLVIYHIKKAPGNPEALNYIKCQKPEARSQKPTAKRPTSQYPYGKLNLPLCCYSPIRYRTKKQLLQNYRLKRYQLLHQK